MEPQAVHYCRKTMARGKKRRSDSPATDDSVSIELRFTGFNRPDEKIGDWPTLVANASRDLAALLEECNVIELDEELEWEISEIANQHVPSNETLLAIFGERFFDDLLLSEIDQDSWAELVDSDYYPTPSTVLFFVVKRRLVADLIKEAKALIERRLETRVADAAASASEARTRPSSLAEGR
jgi:hypothetical protein